MKVQVISDYHTEFRKDFRQYLREIPFRQGVALGICAGDLVCFGRQMIDDTHDVFKAIADNYEFLLYVPGNHEYYGSSKEEVDDLLKDVEAKVSNLRVLRVDQPFEHKGKRFLGDTMWFPNDPINMVHSKRNINDFYQIRNLESWIYEHSDLFIEYIEKECRKGDIVITHHLPSSNSTPHLFKNMITNNCFVNSDAEQLFHIENRPGAWIHGHTHGKCTYIQEEVQVICNPIGYPSENSALPAAAEPSVYDI